MIRVPARVAASLRRHGIRHGMQRLGDRAVASIARPVTRASKVPELSALASGAHGIYPDARTLAYEVFPNRSQRLGDVLRRFSEIDRDLSRRADDAAEKAPFRFSLENESAAFVYLLIRMARPELVVETGVHSGRSTAIILEALEDNDRGRLVSIDVDPSVGYLVPETLRTRWELRVLERDRLPKRFVAALADLPPIDVFLHDSDHDYRWMTHEFRTLRGRLARDAWVLSDDVEKNLAFMELCASLGRRPHLLFDRRKILGVVGTQST